MLRSKNLLLIMIVIIFSCLIVSCDKPQTENNAKPACIIGKVTEKYENSCLLKITDNVYSPLNLNDLVVVNTNISNCPEFEVGDILKIQFDGSTTKSYPPQIFNTLYIEKIDNTN